MDRAVNQTPLRFHHAHGFTLIEVLVALAILAIALTSIYKLQGQTITMSARGRFLTIAPLLAQAQLAEVERREFKDLEDGEGDFGENYPGYRWKLSVEELPTELITDRDHHLVRFNVTVDENNGYAYQLRTYRYYTD